MSIHRKVIQSDHSTLLSSVINKIVINIYPLGRMGERNEVSERPKQPHCRCQPACEHTLPLPPPVTRSHQHAPVTSEAGTQQPPAVLALIAAHTTSGTTAAAAGGLTSLASATRVKKVIPVKVLGIVKCKKRVRFHQWE